MPFEIVRNDIVNMQVDAIVNTANPKPVIGSGTDAAIHAKAGPALLEARKGIGPIRSGDSAITPAFDLDAKYVIHTVGPVWRGGLFGGSASEPFSISTFSACGINVTCSTSLLSHADRIQASAVAKKNVFLIVD